MDLRNLETAQNKKLFFVIIVSILVLIGSVLFIIIPIITGNKESIDVVIKEILRTLFSTIIVTIGLASFFLWLTEKQETAKIEIIKPKKIREYHTQSRKETSRWWYNGGTGRYTRDITLPELLKKRQHIEVRIQILDPTDDKVCEIYSKYRNSIKPSKLKMTPFIVKCDLLATIVTAYFLNEKQSFLNIDIYLKNHFSPFKTEISDNLVLVTRESPKDPAIIYQKNSHFYNAHSSDLIYGFGQSRRIDMKVVENNILQGIDEIKNLEMMHIKILLSSLGMSSISDDELKKILYFIKHKTTQYA